MATFQAAPRSAPDDGARLSSHGFRVVPRTADGVTGDSASDNPLRMQALVFDLAGVLYEASVWTRWLWQLLVRSGVRIDYDTFSSTWQRGYLDDVHCGRRHYDEALQEFLLASGLPWGLVDEVQAASRIRKQELDHGARPLPTVVYTLARLSNMGFTLAVLADACLPAVMLRDKLNQLGIGGYFDAVLSSFDIEYAKPASQCYQAALAAMDCSPSAAAYVGHDARSLGGAREIGMLTIAVDAEVQADADRCIHRFDELLSTVQSSQAHDAAQPHDRTAA